MEVNEHYPKGISYHSDSEHDSLYKNHLKQEGDASDYIRCLYVTLRLDCELIRHSNRLNYKPSAVDHDELGNEVILDPDYSSVSSVEMVGQVERSSLGGEYSFSFFGSTKRVERLRVSLGSVEEGALDGAVIIGLEEEHSFDFDSEEEILICIGMPKDKYDYYVRHLIEKDSMLKISLQLDNCLQCFTSWSPSIDEGRVIKYLGDQTGRVLVEKFDIPESFYTPDNQSLEYSLTLVDSYGDDRHKKKTDKDDTNRLSNDDLMLDKQSLNEEGHYTLDIYANLLSDSKKSTLRWKVITWGVVGIWVISYIFNN